MKVIFLDIDGVLNSNDWYVYRKNLMIEGKIVKEYPLHEFDPKAVTRLNRIIAETGAKIIVSSTWRIGRRVEDLQELLNSVGVIGEVIDVTPRMHGTLIQGNKEDYSVPRGCEIDWCLNKYDFVRAGWSSKMQKEFLEKSKIENYIILDDDSDMLFQQTEHFIQTDFMYGLTDEDADKAIEILNKTIFELYYN